MSDKILVVGGGGREHAIVSALQRAGCSIYAVMKNRNPGIARSAQEFLLAKETDVAKVVHFAESKGVELAFIGPEAPLEVGISDALEERGIGCVGPSRKAARLETSKSFARRLMEEHRISGNLRFGSFDDVISAKKYLDDIDFEVAVKPVGLTGGKGVKVEGEHLLGKDQVKSYVEEIFEHRIGGAGVVLEERAVGEEFTLQAFCDGKHIAAMPLVQDHKRAYEGDVGPNTGGMGSYTDADHLLPFVRPNEKEEAADIMRQVVRALADEGCPYKGVMYGQFMLTRDGPRVIEFNARFGDPEAMNVLTLLESNLFDIGEAIVDGNISQDRAHFRSLATVCKYVVPEGYGTESRSGLPIVVDEKAINGLGAAFYYAAVSEEDGKVLTGTSRAVGVVGLGECIDAAEVQCEKALGHVHGEAIFVRHDIGRPELVQKRVDHMRAIRRGQP